MERLDGRLASSQVNPPHYFITCVCRSIIWAKWIKSPWTNTILRNSFHLDPTCHTFMWPFSLMAGEGRGKRRTARFSSKCRSCCGLYCETGLDKLCYRAPFLSTFFRHFKNVGGNVPVTVNIWNNSFKTVFSLNKWISPSSRGSYQLLV